MANVGDIESEAEDDCEGFYLEPSICNINISERIAEANRELFEDSPAADEDEDDRPRKVQFCEDLVHFELPQQEYYSDDTDTASSEEDNPKKTLQPITEATELQESNEPSEMERGEDLNSNDEEIARTLIESAEEISIPDEADVVTAEDQCIEETAKLEDYLAEKVPVPPAEVENKESEVTNNSKILIVVMPREHNSSFESVLGEDAQEDSEIEAAEEEVKIKVPKEVSEAKPRPKSANKSIKAKNGQKVNCKMSTIAPELNCSVEVETKSWHESPQNTRLKSRGPQKVGDDNCKKDDFVAKKSGKQGVIHAELGETDRPSTSREGEHRIIRNVPTLRPKTAPTKRQCCLVRTNLPMYNGLRSEYGLSTEQLQERKRKTAESKQHRREEALNKQQESSQKRQENAAKFNEWLESKSTRLRNGNTSSSNIAKKDTLVRSDVFIQNNAVYATKCGVSYAVNYSKGKTNSRIQEIRKKTVNLGKLFENLSPHAQKTYRIYLDSK